MPGKGHKPDCQCCCCRAKKGELKFSKETRKKIREAQMGEKNSNWKGGVTISRKIWEKHYGVRIPIDKRTGKTMFIHHRDFNPSNNAWWNLGLLSVRVHEKIHVQYNKFKKWLKKKEDE